MPHCGIGVCLQLLLHHLIEYEAMMKSTASTIIFRSEKCISCTVYS